MNIEEASRALENHWRQQGDHLSKRITAIWEHLTQEQRDRIAARTTIDAMEALVSELEGSVPNPPQMITISLRIENRYELYPTVVTFATQIANIADLLDLSAFYGDYADDYDTDAVRDDYVAALEVAARNATGLDSLTIARNGMVFVAAVDVDDARQVDWRDLGMHVDLAPILQAHELED